MNFKTLTAWGFQSNRWANLEIPGKPCGFQELYLGRQVVRDRREPLIERQVRVCRLQVAGLEPLLRPLVDEHVVVLLHLPQVLFTQHVLHDAKPVIIEVGAVHDRPDDGVRIC